MIQFDTMNRFVKISEAKITSITNFWSGVSTIDHKFFEIFCHQKKIGLGLKKFLIEGILRKILCTVLHVILEEDFQFLLTSGVLK